MISSTSHFRDTTSFAVQHSLRPSFAVHAVEKSACPTSGARLRVIGIFPKELDRLHVGTVRLRAALHRDFDIYRRRGTQPECGSPAQSKRLIPKLSRHKKHPR